MKKICFATAFFICSTAVCAQQKKADWYSKYHIGAGTAVLKGTEAGNTAVAAFAYAGRNVHHNYVLGAGGSFLNFENEKRATAMYAYAEKNTGGKNRQLFFYAEPGLSFPYKPLQQQQRIDRFEYLKKQPGFFFQTGVGIKWMVNRHSFFLRTGYSRLGYSLFTKEYPAPVDPYDPFVEDPIVHEYKFTFSKLVFNAGFTF